MNSLKTAFVVLVLLGVLYGVYRVLNMPDPQFMADNDFGESFSSALQIETGVPSSPGSDTGTDAQPLPLPGDPNSAGELTPIPPPLSALNDSSDSPVAIPPIGAAEETPSADQFSTNTAAPPEPDVSNDFPSVDSRPPLPNPSSDFRPTPQAAPPADSTLVGFDKAWAQAQTLVEEGELREALATLSIYYDSPNLSAAQQRQLQSWLDPLAGKVIYSMEHHLENPWNVRRGDSLESIAKQHDVPASLLYNINRDGIVGDPQNLLPGTELKVLKGPFHAYVDLEQKKMTLFLNDLYAGYFQISVGVAPRPMPGKFIVKHKIAPNGPSNPVGEWFLDLGSPMAIHGTSASGASSFGCIGLTATDAADVSSILSMGSSVVVRR